MTWKHFAPLPHDATLSFGGFSFVHPGAWKRYLDKSIREDYPDYFAEHLGGKWNTGQWRDKESCILTSLENYLFQQFGVCIPEENLFKVYNKEGEGLELSNMLEAISAVIEPLGLEIDRVLAADAVIRTALGESDKVIDEKQAELVDGRPGLCMINIEDGCSHAFFWRKIDKRGFKKERFRLVVLIKRIAEDVVPNLSAVESLSAFIQYFQDTIRQKSLINNAGNGFFEETQSEIQELERFTHNADTGWSEGFRARVEQHLASLLSAYRECISASSQADQSSHERDRLVFEAGRMV